MLQPWSISALRHTDRSRQVRHEHALTVKPYRPQYESVMGPPSMRRRRSIEFPKCFGNCSPPSTRPRRQASPHKPGDFCPPCRGWILQSPSGPICPWRQLATALSLSSLTYHSTRESKFISRIARPRFESDPAGEVHPPPPRAGTTTKRSPMPPAPQIHRRGHRQGWRRSAPLRAQTPPFPNTKSQGNPGRTPKM